MNHRRRSAGRSLVPYLAGALLFQVCVLTGVLASPFVQSWKPGLFPLRDPASHLVRWRRSVSLPDRDLIVGSKAPAIRLSDELGKPFALDQLSGQRVVLIFAGDGKT